MRTALYIAVGLIVVNFFVGCSSPGVMQLSSDTYVISKSSAAGAFTNMAKLRANTIQEANEFAASQGKVAVALGAREVIPAHGFPSYEYQFRLLDKDDPRASGVSLTPAANVIIDKTERISGDIHTTNTSDKKTDLYTEILRLDDLRKRGLITDAEYETQKQRLLNQ